VASGLHSGGELLPSLRQVSRHGTGRYPRGMELSDWEIMRDIALELLSQK
jgi:hypothetical protein